jgi:hypothetical protein
MLLRNFVVEYKLMNGSVGTIRKIAYESNNGPDNDNKLPSYVIELDSRKTSNNGANSHCNRSLPKMMMQYNNSSTVRMHCNHHSQESGNDNWRWTNI